MLNKQSMILKINYAKILDKLAEDEMQEYLIVCQVIVPRKYHRSKRNAECKLPKKYKNLLWVLLE
jgi:hypothetical protein